MRLYLRLCAAILAAGALTAAAEEQPWTLEASNWEKGKDLLPEPVVKRLQKGEYWFKVVSADPSRFHHNYSQAFWDASEKNAGRYGLDEKTCGLKDKAEGLSGEAIAGALEPVDVEGVSTLTKRYWNWDGQDAMWAYVPSTRRARRVNSASRSDPVAGLDIFADDLNCYAGKVEYYEWKLVGEQTILAPLLQPYPFPSKSVSPTRQLIDTPYMAAGYEVPNAKGAPWWIQQNLVFVPRPVWIVEGQSSDPYYNFGKVIMYFDKEMYRIYWKQVHNRAGEYFYTAMCGYHFVKNDETFSAVFPNLVVGVNDKTNRAALGGRYQSSFLEQSWDPSYFSLRTLTHMTD